MSRLRIRYARAVSLAGAAGPAVGEREIVAIGRRPKRPAPPAVPADGAGARRERYPLVQGLRGIAAIWVVLFHISEGHHVDALKAILPGALDRLLFQYGHLGVAIFFALSGFVIAHSLRDATPGLGFLGRFILRRSIRLDPPYWASMLLTLALSWLAATTQHRQGISPDIEQLVAHVFYLQELLHYREINSVYWTLTYEIQFYMVFATVMTIACCMPARLRFVRGAIWGLLYLAAAGNAAGLFDHVEQGAFLSLWASFFVGVLANRTIHERSALLPFAALSLIMLFPLGVPGGDASFDRMAAATAVLLRCSVMSEGLQRWADRRWLEALGTISYSLYLVHNPITGATAFAMRRLFGTGAAAEFASLLVILAVVIAGATLFWWAVERPAHRLSRRISLSPASDGRAWRRRPRSAPKRRGSTGAPWT